MTDYSITPFGQSAVMPSGYPIADNLKTDSAQQSLSAKQGKRLGEVLELHKHTDIDISELTEQDYTLGSNGWYKSGSSGKHVAIQVKAGAKYNLKVVAENTTGAYFGWLTSSYTPPSSASSVPYVDGGSRQWCSNNQEYEKTPPSDAAYLVLVTNDGAGNACTWTVAEDIDGDGAIVRIDEELASMQGSVGSIDEINEVVNGCDDAAAYTSWNAYSGSSYATIVKSGDTITFTKVSSPTNNNKVWYDLSNLENGIEYTISFGYTNSSTSDLWIFKALQSNITTNGDYAGIKIAKSTSGGTITAKFTKTSAFDAFVFTLENAMENNSTVVFTDFSIAHIVTALTARVSALEDPNGYEAKTSGWTSINYVGKKVELPNKHSIRMTSKSGIEQGQGVAIYGKYLFRLYNGGTCKVYDISGSSPSLVNSFDLGSKMSANHANSAQFAPTIISGDDFPLLYVAGGIYDSTNGNRCFVERVTTSGATLVQTIKISADIYDNNSNVQIGDDGYIYMWTGAGTYHIYKFRRVLTTEGDVTLTSSDIIWHKEIVTPYSWDNGNGYIWQGGKIYNGKLYWVFGKANGYVGWWTFDIENGSLDNIVYLSPTVTVELEDFDVVGKYMYFVSYGSSNMYIVYPTQE